MSAKLIHKTPCQRSGWYAPGPTKFIVCSCPSGWPKYGDDIDRESVHVPNDKPANQKASHSPLPWKIGRDGTFYVYSIEEGTGKEICFIDSDRAHENAVLICQAVNAHKKLLDLAIEIARAVDDGMKVPEEIYNGAIDAISTINQAGR